MESLENSLISEDESAKMDALLANPQKSIQVQDLTEKLGGNAAKLVDNLDQLEIIEELTESFNDDIRDNIDQIEVIVDLAENYNKDVKKWKNLQGIHPRPKLSEI